MGLLDFSRKKGTTAEADEPDSIFDRSKDSLKEASIKSAKAAIKGSGLLIRKAYELRINVVNEFSDVKPDWNFVDSDTVKNRIAALEKKLTDARNKQERENLANQLLVSNAMLPNNLRKCDEIAIHYHLSAPFAIHGLLCLKKEQEKDFVGALDAALRYYENNNRISEHPRVSFYTTKALINGKDYREAAKTIKHALQGYPEDKAIHRLALQLHQCMKNQQGVELEQCILKLL